MFSGLFGKKKNQPSVQEIIDEITTGMTGDKPRDVEYLHRCGDKYKSHPQHMEILRHIGRLLAKSLPEEELQAFHSAFDSDITRLQTTLTKATELIRSGNVAGAEKLLRDENLDEGLSEGILQEDALTIYPAFGNPIEEAYYAVKFKPTKTVKPAGELPFRPSYQFAAYIAVENKDYEKALRILNKGIRRCPLATELMFERCEVFKALERLPELWQAMEECAPYCYTKKDIALYFRNLGWYFTHLKDWDAATCCYGVSLMWHDSEMAHRELSYIAQASQRSDDEMLSQLKDVAQWKTILARHSLSVMPTDPLWVQLLWYLGEQAEQGENFGAAAQCFSLHHDLTDSDETKERLVACLARVDSKN